ncbi:DUF429 domain-containing protein [Roseomonas genomospecies 6]|uniref:DUF429 domain-containing protein n=2 Tax=Roseomonas genomospecies 6 TaxID=214106 RepID=A0A9W7KQK4_9PROT|nr:DUF429 domain-containing protein [Roseomonas genomospecies 6]
MRSGRGSVWSVMALHSAGFLTVICAPEPHLDTPPESVRTGAARYPALPMDRVSCKVRRVIMIVQGADGAGRGRLVVVRLDTETGMADWRVGPAAQVLADAKSADLTLVDVPVGLPPTGHRAADLQARRLLGKAWPRVFTGVRRPLLDRVGDLAAAQAWAKRDGCGISLQLFHILPLVRAMDEAIAPALQARVREGHPELTFHRLSGGRFLPRKNRAPGREQRLHILEANGLPQARRWIDERWGTGVAADDVLDASVLALAARDTLAGMARVVPATLERDQRGLRMEMCY